MRFRWKLLMLFLAVALVPTVVISTNNLLTLRQFGDDLISRSRQNRIQNLQQQMQLFVNSYAAVLEADRRKIEMALLFQAREVEKCLATTAAAPAKVYFAQDYNTGENLPADITPSPFYVRSRPNEAAEMLKVSHTHQVFKGSSTADRRHYEKDIRRLSTLTPIYRAIYDQLLGLIFWQTTVLDNGLLGAYPGHNGIPPRLDPRELPWYRNAIQAAESSWSSPYVDPETRRVVIAATRPIRRPNGALAGVTALVMPVGGLLDRRLLSENVAPDAEPFLIHLAKQDQTGNTGARILVSGEHITMEHRSWRIPIEQSWLTSGDTKQFAEMLADLANGVGKVRRMPYQGKDSLWVYGAGYGQSHFVLITPYQDILEQAEKYKQYLQDRIHDTLAFTVFTVLGAILLVTILAFSFSRTITRPIHALEEGARHLSQGEFDNRVDIRSRDEFGDIGRVFNSIGPRLKELYQVRNTLALAMEVQQSLIPKQDPQIAGLDIAGTSIYCDETGGDYYDYLKAGEQEPSKLSIIVGDVSDHGVPSALLMTTARAFLRQRSTGPGTIKDIVADVNRLLARDVGSSGRFMSLFCLAIDAGEPYIRWVRAGHDPAWLYDPGTDTFSELSGKGLPLGVFEDTDYEETGKQVVPGQVITIGTDGIWETANAQGVLFGKEPLKEIIRTHAKASAKEMVTSIIQAIQAFRGTAKQQDDITIVIVKVLDRPGAANPPA
jgi:sigma-B regulation protein RsbU (phosphoserine phosphatase)